MLHWEMLLGWWLDVLSYEHVPWIIHSPALLGQGQVPSFPNRKKELSHQYWHCVGHSDKTICAYLGAGDVSALVPASSSPTVTLEKGQNPESLSYKPLFRWLLRKLSKFFQLVGERWHRWWVLVLKASIRDKESVCQHMGERQVYGCLDVALGLWEGGSAGLLLSLLLQPPHLQRACPTPLLTSLLTSSSYWSQPARTKTGGQALWVRVG